MTVESLLEKLEKGEEVKTPTNSSLLTALQVVIDNDYSKFTLNVNVNNGQMTLKRVGEYFKTK